MLSCKETARLVSDQLDRKLPMRLRLHLRLHLMMCGACAAYRRQVVMLNRIIRRRFAEPPLDSEPTATSACPEEVKQRLRQNLQQWLADGDSADQGPGLEKGTE